MPTFCQPDSDAHRLIRTLRLLALFCAALALPAADAARAQTLAQKNWAGSGVTVQTWWRRGVFYRIDPARFQASADQTTGDLTGIAQRLDYIQSLGVDAILLAPAADAPALTPNDAGWNDLARAAVDRHIRLIVALPAPTSQAAAADAAVLALARAWLTQGVAGLYIPTRAIAQVDGAEHIAALLRQLHALIASVPGDRILLAEAPPPNAEPALTRGLAQNVQLTAAPTINPTPTSAASLRTQLNTALNATDPLLSAARPSTKTTPTEQSALALLLLASRAAVLLDYGEELGLITADNTAPLMQWTPSNRTLPPPPPPPPAPVAAPPPENTVYKPYVPPLPRDLFPPPPMPLVVPVEHPVNARLNPDALPGFTTAKLPPSNTLNTATANVALEDTDPDSLLNLYRRLIQMHHDNPALRNGAQTLFNRDADNALLWLRQAPAGSATVGSALVLCNLSTKPLTLPLDTLHLRIPGLRTLLGTTPTRSANTLTLPPDSIFLGEISR